MRRSPPPTVSARRMFVSLMTAVLVLSPAPLLGGAPKASAQTSPARNGAQVIAQGVAELPDTDVSWNALSLTAGPLDSTGTINANGQSFQSPGFLLALGGPILTVADDGTFLHLLNPGEAAFTPGDAQLNPVSVSAELIPYYGITLLPASGPNSSAGVPFYAGEQFSVETAVRDFDLVRASLEPGQATSLDGGEIPALFLTTDGELELVTPEGVSAVLATEQAVTYGGEISITNIGSGPATFVSAIIGDEITDPAAASRSAPAPDLDPNRGTITLSAFTCGPRPADGTVDPADCAPLTAGFEAQLNLQDGSALRLDDTIRVGDSYRWDGLRVNPDDAQNLAVYTPSQPRTLPGYGEFVITGDISNVGTVALFDSKPNAAIAIYDFADPALGALTIDVAYCPVPANPDAPNPSECAPLSPQSGITIANLDLSLSRGAALYYATTAEVSSATWESLPPGTYTLNQNSSSYGFQSARIAGRTLVCCQAGALSLTVDISEGDVRDTLYLYFPTDGPRDADGDGFSDGDEQQLGSDPLDPTDPGDEPAVPIDADGDGLSAEEEDTFGTSDLSADSDGDGLLDGDEANGLGTDPANADSDGDGFTDGEELSAGTDPNDSLSNPAGSEPVIIDSDGDGLADDDEAALGTDPFNGDTDDDGLDDGSEISLGSDPLMPDQ